MRRGSKAGKSSLRAARARCNGRASSGRSGAVWATAAFSSPSFSAVRSTCASCIDMLRAIASTTSESGGALAACGWPLVARRRAVTWVSSTRTAGCSSRWPEMLSPASRPRSSLLRSAALSWRNTTPSSACRFWRKPTTADSISASGPAPAERAFKAVSSPSIRPTSPAMKVDASVRSFCVWAARRVGAAAAIRSA